MTGAGAVPIAPTPANPNGTKPPTGPPNAAGPAKGPSPSMPAGKCSQASQSGVGASPSAHSAVPRAVPSPGFAGSISPFLNDSMRVLAKVGGKFDVKPKIQLRAPALSVRCSPHTARKAANSRTNAPGNAAGTGATAG